MSVLAFERFSYAYPGVKRPALRELSLEIEAGEFVVLAGRSASGKSTLLRAANGLVPHFHGGEVAGRVTVNGVDTRAAGPGELARVVGSLFQDPETQVVMGSPRAEMAFPLENHGLPAAAVARGVEEAALALGIADLLDRSCSELSGGELQRVALGAALAGHPRLLLLDEPTSQLDPVAGDELISLLRRLNEDTDVAILLCEHRLERCLTAADRVLGLVDGQLACAAAPEEFLAWAAEAAPELQTPGAKLLATIGLPPRAGVRAARAELRNHGLEHPSGGLGQPSGGERPERAHLSAKPILRLRNVWHELRDGPAILRGVTLAVADGERIALMGRNGAGKSTLLRHAASLMEPTRGRVERAGRVGLLLQNPNDYLVHETVAEEVSEAALARVGLEEIARTHHPRDLSGGERQRLALAVVLDGEVPPALLCLDEPTRGMDRGAKEQLAAMLQRLDTPVIVATHDPEFAAAFATRVILLAGGAVIADGTPSELLAGGTYFATETARILDGAALTPEHGAAIARRELVA